MKDKCQNVTAIAYCIGHRRKPFRNITRVHVFLLVAESSTPLFVGAVLNMLNDTFYYDWLSRPGTWSLPTESNMSGDGKCLLFKDGGLEQKPCSSTMNITVCEKGRGNTDCEILWI